MDRLALKRRRKERGLTQAQLAYALDVTQQTVQQWESGKRPIPAKPVELYPGQEGQEDERLFEPSVNQRIEEILWDYSDEEIAEIKAEASNGPSDEDDVSPLDGEQRRRLFEDLTGKVAGSRPKVAIGSNAPKRPKPKQRKPAPVIKKWLPPDDPDSRSSAD